MSRVIFVCGGCGRQEDGGFNAIGDAFKPLHWFRRTDKDGTQLACSRACVAKVAEESGKTSSVLPI